MARVTALEVQEIIEVDSTVLETTPDLTPYISAATSLVDELLVGKHDDDRLKEIERWLAAHFVAIRDVRRSSEKAGTVSESYQYKLGLGLSVTMHGQQAVRLDTSGTLYDLDQIGQKRSAIVKAIR